MEREAQLVGGYGRDRKEFLKYKSALLQAEKHSRSQANNRKLKEFYRKSPTPRKSSELRPFAHSQPPVSHRTLSHKELAKRESLHDREATPTEDSIRDTTLNNYYWPLEDDLDTSMTLLNGKVARTGPKLVAAVEQHAEYYEQELRKQLDFLDEEDLEQVQRSTTPATHSDGQYRVKDYLNPTYSLKPQVDMSKHESLKKITHRDPSSDLKVSVIKALPSIHESGEPVAQGRRGSRAKGLHIPSKLSRRVKASPDLDEEAQDLRQQKLEASIHELDQLLLRLKHKQNIRSASVAKESKGLPQRRRQEKIPPRLKLPSISAHE